MSWSRNKRNTTRDPQHVFRPYNVDASPSPRFVKMISRFFLEFYVVLLAIILVFGDEENTITTDDAHDKHEYYCKLIKESFSFCFSESRGHDSAITPTHTTLTGFLTALTTRRRRPQGLGEGGISIRISLHVAVSSAI